MKKVFLRLLPALLAGAAGCHSAGAPLPPGTYTYVRYVVGLTGQPNTVFDHPSGHLTLNPDGTYSKELSLTGVAEEPHANDQGTYKLSGNDITFDFPDRHDGLPHTYGGTFRYVPGAKALTLHLNDNGQGMYEQVGLVQQGTEAQARTFADDGSASMAQ